MPGAYKRENLNDEIRRVIIDQGHYTEADHLFKIKPNFTTLESIIEIFPRRPIISFIFDDIIRKDLGFRETVFYQDFNLSHNRIDILSFDNIFLESDIAHVIIFQAKRSGVIHTFTMGVNPGFKNIEKFRGRVQWYIMESKNIISSLK